MTEHNTASQFDSLVEQIRSKVDQFASIKRWWLAFSGGVDSTVLLHICVTQLQLHKTHKLTAVYIDHQLQPLSRDWGEHCRTFCQLLGVECQIVPVDVDITDGGVEAAARAARYQQFERLLNTHSGMLMAHHLDDQAETFLLRLVRGAGVKGLSAIPESRALGDGVLLRPMLNASKETLEAYARNYWLQWLEDPSNLSSDFDRNFLRHDVIPLLKNRWPEFAISVSRSAELCAQADLLNSELAQQDIRAIGVDSVAGQGLSLTLLQQLSQDRQINVVRHWLADYVQYLPDGKTVEHWLKQSMCAEPDAMPQFQWQGLVIRRYQNALFLTAQCHQQQPMVELLGPTVAELSLGLLHWHVKKGDGLRYQTGQQLSVSFQPLSQKFYLAGREGGRTLKKIFQEQQVPYWMRASWPLLLVDHQPAALLGFAAGPLVLEGFKVGADESGIVPLWQFRPLQKRRRS